MKKSSIVFSLLLFVMVALFSCSKWDDYKKYTKDGEILYSGKVDSLKIFSGNQRVRVQGLLPADPKIVKVKVSWNDGKDSIVYNITKGVGIELFEKDIAVSEGVVTFKVQTYDAAGNSSLITSSTGTIYGPKYQSGLNNRSITSAELLTSGTASIVWGSFDSSTGAQGTWVKYTKVDNKTDSLFVPVTQNTTSLPNYKSGTPFMLRTQYLPSATSIDLFYSPWQTAGIKYDITNQYMVNTGPGFIATVASGTGRWRIPQDWIVTDDVKNAGGLGGLDAGSWLPSVALSMEAWDGGMGTIPNGKIYQTINLPAGKYAFMASTGDIGGSASKYLTVAIGSSLPDFNDVASKALVFISPTKNTDNTITFTLSAASQVSLGIQSSMTPNQNFIKVFKVRLYSMP
ncbi:MAG TPA: DUF4998 domain-containing protein [Pelobium sp.]|nr:DUF4998 domain-containing protein [Pelobium sp.]